MTTVLAILAAAALLIASCDGPPDCERLCRIAPDLRVTQQRCVCR